MIEFRGPPTHPHYLRHLAWQFLDPSQCREQWKCNHWRSNRIKSTYSGICRCASWCSMMHHHTRPVYSLQSQWCGMMWHHVDHKWSIMMCRAAACCTRTFYILVDVTTSQHLLSAWLRLTHSRMWMPIRHEMKGDPSSQGTVVVIWKILKHITTVLSSPHLHRSVVSAMPPASSEMTTNTPNLGKLEKATGWVQCGCSMV